MKIIIEGPDNIGKSTLINNIIKALKLPFTKLHYYGPPYEDKNLNIDFEKSLYKDMFFIFNNIENIISDRSHLGCLVYNSIYRNYDSEFVLDIELENYHLLDEIFLIVLIDHPDNLIKRDDGKSFTVDRNKKGLEIDKFIETYHKTNIKNKILIDVSDKPEEKLCEIVLKFLLSKN